MSFWTEGAVIFSMCSILATNHFNGEQREILVRAMGRLKQRVIWKYNKEKHLPVHLPKNILIREWVPQMQILANNWHSVTRFKMLHRRWLRDTRSISIWAISQRINLFRSSRRFYRTLRTRKGQNGIPSSSGIAR